MTCKPGVQSEARKGEGGSFRCKFLGERMGVRTAVLNDIVYSVHIYIARSTVYLLYNKYVLMVS